jgi:outer membrane protein assembly factor BamB
MTPTAALLLALMIPAAPADGAWPGFRGHGDSAAAGDRYPTKWSPTAGVAWKVDLPGYGQSAPVVWNGTIYLTAVEGEQKEKGYVLALDAKTGKEKWRHTLAPTQKAKSTYTVSRAAPTPCADADRVYVFFEGGNLLALTHAGAVAWERSLVTDYGEFKGGHGIGSSPAQTADALFVLIDHAGPSYLLAVDKATGKTKWKKDRDGKMSWTSPTIATQGGKPVVIASSNGSVAAYAADTGDEAWKLAGVVGNTLPSATVVGDAVLVGTGAGRGKEPAKDAKTTCCLTLTETDGKPGYAVRWTGKAGVANYASPVASGGVGYFVNAVGVLYGYDLKSGRELFAERIGSPCWATPVTAGGHLYCFGKDGTTTVLKPGPTFRVVETNKLWDGPAKPAAPAGEGKGPGGEYMDPIVYGVAAADGGFYVRTGTALYCLRQ